MSSVPRVSGVISEFKNGKTQLISETLEHVGTKQEIFMETHLCLVNRFKIAPEELFVEAKALEYMKKNQRKRQSHCTARLMEDRISLERCKNTGSKPFRFWLYYGEVVDIYTSPIKKQFFTLCVQSVSTQQKYYEIYKCKTTDQTEKFIKFIQQANSDPNNVLRSVNGIRTTTVTQDLVRQSICDFAIYDVENTDDETESDSQQEIKPKSNHQQFHHKNKNHSSSYSKSPQNVDKSRRIQTVRNELHHSPILNHLSRSLQDLKDVTYILIDSKQAPHVTDSGPIYMYCTRQRLVVNDNENGYSDSNNNYEERSNRSRSKYR